MTPHLPSLDTLRLLSGSAFRSQHHGARRAKDAGGRMEFVGHRRYVPGDDPRRVDWNVVARTDRVLVKEYLRESALPVHLLIDVSDSMTLGDPPATSMAFAVARGLAHMCLRHADVVSIAGVSDTVGGPTRATGRGGMAAVDDAIARMTPRSVGHRTDLARAIRGYTHGARRPGLAVLISDFIDPRGIDDALRTLQVAQYSVAVIHIVTPQLLEPDLPPDVRVEDVETGEARDLAWNADTRAAYARSLEEFLCSVEDACARRGVRYARARSDSDPTDVFLRELRDARIVA